MADEKPKYPVNLYDANGAQTGTAEHDEDLLNPTMRDSVIESGGKTYRWDQRTSRWTEVAAVVKLGKAQAVEAPAAEKK